MKLKHNGHKVVDLYAKYDDIDEMYSSKPRKVDLTIPSKFRMLCAILNVKAEIILSDFMWTMSYSYSNDATERKRKAAIKFFLICGYGQPNYTENDIREIFKELKAQRILYNTTKQMPQDDRELYWKNDHMYIQHWFKRWFYKTRTTDDVSILDQY